MDAFVYIWEDIPNKKFYIGSHKGTEYDGYTSSSVYLEEEMHGRPTDFKRTIVGWFETYEQACHAEAALCRKVDAKNNPNYYNRHNGDGEFRNKGHSDLTKAKLSKVHKGKPKSAEHRAKISAFQTGKKRGPCSEERKRKIGNANRGRKRKDAEILRAQLNNWKINRTPEEEQERREKIKQKMKMIWQQRKSGELPTPKVFGR